MHYYRTICVGELVEPTTKCFVLRDYTEINFQNEFNEIIKYKSRHCMCGNRLQAMTISHLYMHHIYTKKRFTRR